MKWNAKEFGDLVERLYGHEQRKALNPSLSSLGLKLFLCHYHSSEARQALKTFNSIGDYDQASAVHFLLSWASGAEGSDKLYEAQFIIKANVVAFAQSLHSTADILAQIIYHGFNFEAHNNGKIQNKWRYISNISNKLYEIGIAADVKQSIDRFLDTDEYKYLRAFVNTLKHHALVDINYSVNATGHGIVITNFEYDDEEWPKRSVEDFLNKSSTVVNNGIIKIGQDMTKYLRELL